MRCCSPAAAVVAVALLPLAGAAAAQEAPAPGDVVVNEILYDPPSESDPGEYVELLNRSGRTFDLSGFEIADSRDAPTSITGEAQALAPGEYAVLVQDGEAFAAAFPGVPFVEPGSWPQLNNGGDTAQLLFEDAVIDAVPYTPSWGGEDVALERIDPAGPPDEASNFGDAQGAVGTPGAQNSIFAGGPDETPPTLDSVQVAASRTALTAFFSEPLDPASVAASAFSIEAAAGGAPDVAEAFVAGEPTRVELALSGEIESGEYVLVAAGVQDEAGNALGEERAAFTVAPGGVPGARDVVVNELWYAPEDAALEFVEVFNRTEEAFDLSGFRLADERREPVRVTDQPALLEPGGYAVFVRDSAAFARRFPSVDFAEVSPWPALNNGGDTAVLFFGETEVDAVPYEPGWGGSDTTSLERADPAGPSASAANFAASTAPGGATPGTQNAVFMRDITAPRPVFARKVLGAANVFSVIFAEPVDAASVAPARFALGGAQPDAARVGEGGRSVRLVFGSAPGGPTLTVRGVADLTGNALEEASVPVAFVAEPYAARPPGDLVVNEILYDPLDDDFDDQPNQPEFVELYNPTERRLALEGYYLTDRPDENGESDSLAIGRPRASVAPGGYAVAYAAEGAPIEEAFPEADFADSAAVTLLPVDRASLGLTNGGGLVALRRPDGALLDSVFYRPEWQSAAVESGDGRALERLDPLGPSNRATNWQTATAARGGTPGRSNGAMPPPGSPSAESGVEIVPSPFSPDGDGFDDVAFIRYALSTPVSLVRIRVYDSMGREVYEDEARLAGREGEVVWQGRSEDGDRLNVGVYVVLFEALDAGGGTVEAFKEPVVLARPLE